MDAETGKALYRGKTKVSPGRLAASSDMRFVLSPLSNGAASVANQARVPFLSAVRASDAELSRWSTGSFIGEDYARIGGIAVAPDDKEYLVGTARTKPPIRSVVVLPNIAPFKVTKFPMPINLSNEARAPRATGSLTLGGLAAVIMVDPETRHAHVLAGDDNLYSIDIPTMTFSGEAIELAPILGPPNDFHVARVNYAHSTLSEDGRLAISNRGPSNQVNVANLVARDSQTFTLSADIGFVGGVDVSKGWNNRGVLAVHAIDRIIAFRFDPASGFEELGRVDIDRPPILGDRLTNPTVWDGEGPKFSLAWTASGKHIVAAADSGDAEFAVLSVRDEGRTLTVERHLKACDETFNSPLGIVTLNGRVTPPARPTVPETATSAASPSSTPTPTSMATASATLATSPSDTPVSGTATSTALPTSALYLPLTLRETCVRELRRVDILMVIDASTSMQEPTSAGRSKLDAARDAAMALVDELDFAAGDQGGLVVFNEDAVASLALGSSRSELEAALAAAASAPGTCVPCGLAAAEDLLFGPEHRLENTPALILLTDGESNVQPIGEAIPMAERMKDQGAQIFTIGLGAEVEAAELRQIASSPDHYFGTTDAEALEFIFERILIEIPCPPSDFWSGR